MHKTDRARRLGRRFVFAMLDVDELTLDTVVARADAELYRAKRRRGSGPSASGAQPISI